MESRGLRARTIKPISEAAAEEACKSLARKYHVDISAQDELEEDDPPFEEAEEEDEEDDDDDEEDEEGDENRMKDKGGVDSGRENTPNSAQNRMSDDC